MGRISSLWLARLLLVLGVCCFGCWFVTDGTYDASEYQERATFVMGWPTIWYSEEVQIDAWLIAAQPDFVIQKRPYPPQGPDGVWRTKSGGLEKFPDNLPGGTGWNTAVCRKRSAVNPLYGPLVPTLVGLGCFYVAWRLFSDAGRQYRKTSLANDPPPSA